MAGKQNWANYYAGNKIGLNDRAKNGSYETTRKGGTKCLK